MVKKEHISLEGSMEVGDKARIGRAAGEDCGARKLPWRERRKILYRRK